MSTQQVFNFLALAGLPVCWVDGASGFVPGVRILNGALAIDPRKALASDVLHEAGHLCVVPGRFRHLMGEDVDAGVQAMLAQCRHLDPDNPLMVQVMQSGECEATAWSWAAGMHLGLDPQIIIENASFEGTGAQLRLALKMGHHFGVHGLARAGFCDLRKNRPTSGPVFPHLRRWLQTH